MGLIVRIFLSMQPGRNISSNLSVTRGHGPPAGRLQAHLGSIVDALACPGFVAFANRPLNAETTKSFGHKWLDDPFSVSLCSGPLDLAHLHSDRKLEHSAAGCGS